MGYSSPQPLSHAGRRSKTCYQAASVSLLKELERSGTHNVRSTSENKRTDEHGESAGCDRGHFSSVMELSALLAQTEFDSLNDDTRDELEALQFTLSEGEVTALHVDAAAASVALHVRIGVPDWPAANVRVTFRTDARYPEQHACSFEIDGSDIIREQVLNELTERLQQTSEELLGSPALLCLIENVGLHLIALNLSSLLPSAGTRVPCREFGPYCQRLEGSESESVG